MTEIKENKLLRSIREIKKNDGKYITIGDKKYIDFSSNNYLGLRDDERVKEAACKAVMKYGAGSGASRLVTGTADIYSELEESMAKFKRKDKCILFNSGYDANIGVISAIMDKNDIIFSDRLNHASIIDGAVLSGAKLVRYKHNDIKDLEEKIKKYRKNYKKAMVVTDTIFSMDGDKADLQKISELKIKNDFIFMVDEAHAGGIFGDGGAGIAEEQGVLEDIDISMGTLGKAFGGQGAYVCSSQIIIDFIINRARSLIFSTAINPAAVGAAIKSLEIIKTEPFRSDKILKNAEYLRTLLNENGFETMDSKSQIVPVLFYENEKTVKVSEFLYNNGIIAVAIRPPAVPINTARIRLSVNYNIEIEDIKFLIEKIREVKKWI